MEGQKHLGAVIGSRDYFEKYSCEKVFNWVSEVAKLAEFAFSQPQACGAATDVSSQNQCARPAF